VQERLETLSHQAAIRGLAPGFDAVEIVEAVRRELALHEQLLTFGRSDDRDRRLNPGWTRSRRWRSLPRLASILNASMSMSILLLVVSFVLLIAFWALGWRADLGKVKHACSCLSVVQRHRRTWSACGCCMYERAQHAGLGTRDDRTRGDDRAGGVGCCRRQSGRKSSRQSGGESCCKLSCESSSQPGRESGSQSGGKPSSQSVPACSGCTTSGW
jgi:hypothetical protein